MLGKLRRFLTDRRGVAAVEFALILPFLLVLYAGSVEVSEMITADRRVNTISGTVGDLVARADGTVSQSELVDYVDAARIILDPFPTTRLQQVISCVFVDVNGNTSVLWSRAYNGATARSQGQPYPNLAVGVSDMNDIARGKYVIVSEARYSYTPVFGLRINEGFGLTSDLTTINMYHENFFMTRFGEAITISNS